jgi:hypothetical protein
MITDARLFARATGAGSDGGDGLQAAAALVRAARDVAVRRGDDGCATALASLADALRRIGDAQAGTRRRGPAGVGGVTAPSPAGR